jgi:hypothetical protein
MSMSFSVKITKTICDKDNKKILKYPIDTILDNIVNDLWTDIIKYMDFEFAIGCSHEIYAGYRKINEKEFEEFKSIFGTYYAKNGGIKILPGSSQCSTFSFSNCPFGIEDNYTQINNNYAMCEGENNKMAKIYSRFGRFEGQLKILSEKITGRNYFTIMIPNILCHS